MTLGGTITILVEENEKTVAKICQIQIQSGLAFIDGQHVQNPNIRSLIEMLEQALKAEAPQPDPGKTRRRKIPNQELKLSNNNDPKSA